MKSIIKQFTNKTQQKLFSADPYVRVLYICNIINLVGGAVYGLYYGVFLYKSTFSLSVLAVNGLLSGVGIWLGYLVGVTIIRRFGYSRSVKFAFGLMAAVAFLTAGFADQIASWYMILAVIRSLPTGIFTASIDALLLREVHITQRNSFLQSRLAIEFFVSIILPASVGMLISQSSGYHYVFLISGIIYAAGLFIPLNLPKARLNLDLRDVIKIFKRPMYKEHAANRTISAGFNQMNAFVLTIIPFLMLKDEFSVGILTSGVALLAVGVSLYMKRVGSHKRLAFGFGAYAVRSIMSLLFVVVWTAPIMVVWQLVNKLVTPLHDPLQQGLDIHNDSLIMGEELQEKALQINVLNNTLLFAGSTLAYASFLLISRAATNRQDHVLQLLIVTYALWRILNLAATVWINKRAHVHAGAPLLQTAST